MPGLSLELAIASASASILALSLSSCGLVTMCYAVEVLRPRRSLCWTICTRLHTPRSSSPLPSTLGARHSRDDEYAIPQSHPAQKIDAAQSIFRGLVGATNNQVPTASRGKRFDPLS